MQVKYQLLHYTEVKQQRLVVLLSETLRDGLRDNTHKQNRIDRLEKLRETRISWIVLEHRETLSEYRCVKHVKRLL